MEARERRRLRRPRPARGRDASAAAAAAAGVERIVYLGGIAPAGRQSPHLRSRLEVEEILLDAVPRSTALRASIVIGAGSSSFRVLVRLVERLRVLPLPELARQPHPADRRARRDRVPRPHARACRPPRAARWTCAGPDVVTYGEMIERIAEPMGVGRMPLGLGVSLTPPASAVVAAVTGQPLELVRPLMESLEIGHPARATPARRRASTACARAASSAPSSTRSPSGRRSEALAAR